MTRSRDLANLADGTEFTAADHTKLDGIETSATADQTGAQIKTAYEAESDTNAFTDADHSKLDGIAASANNYVHPNHSGEVSSTADGATVISDNVVDEANLKVSNTPTNGYFLSAQSGNTGGMTWAEVAQPTAAETLTTIKTVDGTGSGLDADLLDGQHGSYYAPIGSPTLTGTPAAPTASAGTNSTQISTTAYVDSAISALADSAPAALNTLNELAAALGDDANYAATTTTAIGTKLAKAGGQMTGNITMSGTETVDGRDLSVDGAKLDTIEASATADQTAAQLLTAIKTVDGASSGLDADLLDGNQASAFATSAQGTLATNALPKAGGTVTGDVQLNTDANIHRGTHSSGHLVGSYNNIGDNSGKTNPIYSIGTSYQPTDTALSNHYGIGYTRGDASFMGVASGSGWGMYVSGDGDARIFLDGSNGNMYLTGTVDGRDVAADGTKLDTIATSANNYSFPYTVSTSESANTVAQRQANGYLFASYFNGSGTFATTGAGSGMGNFTGNNGSDTYGRSYNAAAARTLLNVSNGATANLTGTAASTINTTVERNASGDINVRLVRSEYSTTNSTCTYFMTQINQTDNNYVRPSTVAQVKTALGITTAQSSFLRSDTADTASGDITFNGGAGAVTIGANGDIRSSSNNWSGESHGKIQYHSNNWYMQYYTQLIHRNSGGSNRMVLDASGNVTFSGNVTAYSDIRLKENIRPIENAVDLVGQMRGVFYTEKETKEARVGVIAQELEKVLPEVVRDNEQYNPETGKTEDSIKSVNYGNIVGVLIEAIKELKAEVEELKNGSS